jgi:hypothetical protein
MNSPSKRSLKPNAVHGYISVDVYSTKRYIQRIVQPANHISPSYPELPPRTRSEHVQDTEYVHSTTTEVRNASTLSGKDKHTQEAGRPCQYQVWLQPRLTSRYCSDIIDTAKAKPKIGHTPILDGKEMASCGLDACFREQNMRGPRHVGSSTNYRVAS